VTFGGANFDARSARVRIMNNFEHVGTVDTKSAASKRLPDAIVIGHEQANATLEFLADPAIVFHSDALPVGTFVIVLTNEGTVADTQTITGTSWKVDTFRRGFVADGLISWEVDLTMVDNTEAALTIVDT
jgi:hypothetical protein